MTKHVENELDPRLQATCALNPLKEHDSASREQMYSTHLGQMLVLNGSTPRSLQSGAERNVGEYTFRVEMPCDGIILDIIERYPYTEGMDAIAHNPETIVIYEEAQTRVIGFFALVEYCKNHQYFGFKYKPQPGLEQIKIGARIKKGTVFLDSPSISPDGDYCYGIEANVAFMAHPAVAEDGVVVSRDFLPKAGFKTYETRVIEWGKDVLALNLYGTPENPKPFPEIGQRVRADGVVMALRSYELPELAVVEQSVYDQMEIDYTFDTRYHATPGGKVVDVKIDHHYLDQNIAEEHTDHQAQKYDQANRKFCNRIVNFWQQQYAKKKYSLEITPHFQMLIRDCLSVTTDNTEPTRINKLYHKAPINTYRVEITIEYEYIPTNGFKLTGCFGNKGVICEVVDPEEMPLDSKGNRADIIMDQNSLINRAIPSAVFEQYINASSREAYQAILAMTGTNKDMYREVAQIHLEALPEHVINTTYQYLLDYYHIVSKEMYAWWEKGLIGTSYGDKIEYLAEIIEKGKDTQQVGKWLPVNHQEMTQDIILNLEKSVYRPTRGPVRIRDADGNYVYTIDDVLIGSCYVILLEKIADDWSAVNSAKTQVHGVIAPLTRGDKFTSPVREQGVRGIGEAEGRNTVNNIGARFTAELMDRNGSPRTHRAICETILTHDTPSNIDSLVDRREIPFGSAVPDLLIKHMLQVGGIKFVHKEYDPSLRGIETTGEEDDEDVEGNDD